MSVGGDRVGSTEGHPGGSAGSSAVNHGGGGSSSWSSRPARPRPSLNVGGPYSSGLSPVGASATRRTPGSLSLTPSPGDPLRSGSGVGGSGSGGLGMINGGNGSLTAEQEKKLKEIMEQTNQLLINGRRVKTQIDDLELLGDLGNGTCGHVVKMRHKPSGMVLAVKQMRRTGNSDENKRILMDLDVVLKSHDCREIVLCLGCFITGSDVWICMELMSTCFDKLLKQLKQPIPEPICGKVAVATLKALHYLKEVHGVIHRDIKPSNILLDAGGRIKLCDFGISGRLVDSKAKTRSAGCAAYMAPERIDPPQSSKADYHYDIRADVWSLGITLVEMATGHFPYRECKTDFEVLTKVLQDDPPCLPRNGGFSPEFCSFVRDCLMKNYKDRPKYKKLLLHPFVQRYDDKDGGGHSADEVDVGAWYRATQRNLSNGGGGGGEDSSSKGGRTAASAATVVVNNNGALLSFENALSAPSSSSSFKPQPSPRVVRAWRPSNCSSNHPSSSSASVSTAAAVPALSSGGGNPKASSPLKSAVVYPSAIGEQQQQLQRHHLQLREREQQQQQQQQLQVALYKEPRRPSYDSPLGDVGTRGRRSSSNNSSAAQPTSSYLQFPQSSTSMAAAADPVGAGGLGNVHHHHHHHQLVVTAKPPPAIPSPSSAEKSLLSGLASSRTTASSLQQPELLSLARQNPGGDRWTSSGAGMAGSSVTSAYSSPYLSRRYESGATGFYGGSGQTYHHLRPAGTSRYGERGSSSGPSSLATQGQQSDPKGVGDDVGLNQELIEKKLAPSLSLGATGSSSRLTSATYRDQGPQGGTKNFDFTHPSTSYIGAGSSPPKSGGYDPPSSLYLHHHHLSEKASNPIPSASSSSSMYNNRLLIDPFSSSSRYHHYLYPRATTTATTNTSTASMGQQGRNTKRSLSSTSGRAAAFDSDMDNYDRFAHRDPPQPTHYGQYGGGGYPQYPLAYDRGGPAATSSSSPLQAGATTTGPRQSRIDHLEGFIRRRSPSPRNAPPGGAGGAGASSTMSAAGIGGNQRSPSNERGQPRGTTTTAANYLSSFKSTLSNWGASFPSNFSTNFRQRTTSSDRSAGGAGQPGGSVFYYGGSGISSAGNVGAVAPPTTAAASSSSVAFDRRHQPRFRSWNEKDNYSYSMRR